MKRLILVVALMFAACLVFAENTVSLNIKDMPVREVISNLMAQSDVNIIMTDDARMDKKIRINLSNCEFEKALTYIMEASGLSYKKVDEATYIIGGGADSSSAIFNPESLLSNVTTPVETSSVFASTPAPEKKFRSVKMIELQHVGASELLRTLGWDNSARGSYNQLSNYKTHNARIKYQDDGEITVPSINPYINDGSGRVASINNIAGARNSNSSSSSSNSGSSRNSGNSNSNSSSSSNGSSSGSSFGGAISFLDAYNASDPTTGYPYFEALIPYDLNNSIMVRGDEDAIKHFQEDIAVFDIPPRQVEIKCEFVEISTSESKSFGIDWAIGRQGRWFQTSFGVDGNVAFVFQEGNLTASVAAELTESVGKLVNAPIISTLNNIEGYISYTHTIPRFTSSVSGDGVNPIATYDSEDVDVTTDLYVTPRINRDNSITMVIDANVSDYVRDVQSPDGKSSSPETTDQEISTIRRVMDGETVVIGGLVRQSADHNVQKIPLLGDLPLIGSLFRTETTTKQDNELLIFITPRIIHDSINMNKLIN